MRLPHPAIVLATCAAVRALAIPPVPEVAKVHSLIANGGFEEGDALPSFWSRHPGDPRNRNGHLRDTAVAHSGSASGKLLWLDPIAGENKAALQWMKYGIPVEGGSSLLVSGYVRTGEGVPGSRVGIHLYDQTGTHLGFHTVSELGPTPEWQPFGYELPLPQNAAKMGIALYSRQGGATWYDDIAVIGTPSATAERATPNVDGALAEACYAPERATTAFVVHDGSSLPSQATRAWLAHDDQFLYVAFHCPFAPDGTLKLEATERDGKTWLDDSVEIFLDPGHSHAEYVQFCVNAAGIVRDSRGQDESWDCGVRAAARREPAHWTVEIAIPFADLELPTSVGPVWGINLVRNDRMAGETSTWSLGGFHHPSRFGNVRLATNFAPFLGPAFAKAARAEQDRMAELRRDLEGSGLPQETFRHVGAALKKAEAEIRACQTHAARRFVGEEDLAVCRRHMVRAQELRAEARALAIRHALVPPGSHFPVEVSIADSSRKILPDDSLEGVGLRTRVLLSAARDETESFQLALRSPGEARQATVEAPPLSGPGGPLPLRWHRVECVVTGKPRGYTPRSVGRWPDVLLPPGPVELPADERKSVWIGADVPPDTVPGIYVGTVSVHCGDTVLPVPVELRVRSFRLPRPGSLACPFGIYASALSRWYFGTSDYAKHITPEQYAVWCEFLGRYRLTPKNVANEFLRNQPDGTVDAQALRTTLAPFVEPLYPPSSFCMYRLPCPRDWQNGTTTEDPEIQMARLRAKRDAYLKLGLPSTAYVYGIDEPSPEGYPFVRDIYLRTKKAAPEFPIMQTLNHRIPKELAGTVDIWCPLSARYDEGRDFYQERLAAGERLWLYVCCGPKPPYANFFVDQEGAAHRVLFWQTWQARATGLLYWCVIWWDGMPRPTDQGTHFPEAMPDYANGLKTYHQFGVNGDGVLIWPGPDLTPWPSLRLEIVRDGIEDYEYLSLLDRCVRAATTRPEIDGELLERAKALLAVPPTISRTMKEYAASASPILERRAQAGDMIEALLAKIGQQPPVEFAR